MKPVFTYKPSAGHLDKCKKFAELCVETNLDEYKRRRQFNKTKITNDILVGKIAEIGAYAYVKKNLGYSCTLPDYEIYEARKKSFGADLKARDSDGNDFEIHVKSQLKKQAKKYGESWMFQARDKLVTKPKDQDWLVLCQVGEDYSVDVLHFIEANRLTGIYGEPQLSWLSSKKALYNKSVETLLRASEHY